MRIKNPFLISLILFSVIAVTSCNSEKRESPEPGWPEITRETKPWSRWWWMASGVDTVNLKLAMEQYAAAGLGGLEITPIYGVHGYEGQFVKFLSPEWIDLFEYVLRESVRLDIGIDLAMASGWPFGGRWVTPEDACRMMHLETWSLKEGERLNEKVARIQEPLLRVITRKNLTIGDLKDPIAENADSLQAWAIDQVRFPRPMILKTLMAYPAEGEPLDLTPEVAADGTLDWTAPAGEWNLVALFEGWHGKLVERAGPGGEGDVIDHFSAQAIDNYLVHFTNTFEGHDISPLRAWFNDSYEVDDARGEADFTPLLLEEFQKRRGYDLRHFLPALLGQDDEETNRRVLTDYRETISDLILENYTRRWHDWAKRGGKIIRNQAHGAPANILDLYAAADIPETEGEDIVKVKSASSAAHVTGKKLTSSESATWLKDHFEASLADVKQAVDLFLLAGINHIFFHGTTYSPQEALWPGWMFYAAVHFGPTNTFWNDFATLNGYITRSQSFLQSGKPDNDILLYYPIYDEYAIRGRSRLLHFDGSAANSALRPAALELWKKGYAFDYISDRQINQLSVSDAKITTGGAAYQTLLLPPLKIMPPETFEALVKLARQGATILMEQLPEDVPGMGNLRERQEKLSNLKEKLTFETATPGIQMAKAGKGRILTGEREALLSFAQIRREPMADLGLQSIRRVDGQTTTWFIANRGAGTIDQTIPLSKKGTSAVLYNPMDGAFGKIPVSVSAEKTMVRLNLVPGESCILQLFPGETTTQDYRRYTPAGEKTTLQTEWKIVFKEGGPGLPEEITGTSPELWTNKTEEAYASFSGTAVYSTTFPKPADEASHYRIDLGEVLHSARIHLNGKEQATLISPPFAVIVPAAELREENQLEIAVTNLMGNRIADMERKGVPYKIFYNVNFPAFKAHNRGGDGLFTTLGWPPQPSGLAGPVTISPLTAE